MSDIGKYSTTFIPQVLFSHFIKMEICFPALQVWAGLSLSVVPSAGSVWRHVYQNAVYHHQQKKKKHKSDSTLEII